MKPALPRLFAAFLSLILLSPSAFGADEVPWYEVELIVFVRPAATDVPEPSSALAEESALQSKALPRELLPPRVAPAEVLPFQQLPATALRLTRDYERLDAAKEYKPLLHIGWVQPGFAREQSVPVHLQGTAAGAGKLDGTVRLVLSRFLHLETDLRLVRVDETGSGASFRLAESRRMRSKEVHYLDHPMLGVIALVTPYEQAPKPH